MCELLILSFLYISLRACKLNDLHYHIVPRHEFRSCEGVSY